MWENVPSSFSNERFYVSPRNKVRALVDSSQKNQADVLTPKQFKNLLLIAGDGVHGLRNRAIVWHSFGSALRVTEIAQLKVRDVLDRSGNILELGTLPSEYTKNGKARAFVQVEPDHRAALDAYINWRVEHRIRVSSKRDYRGLLATSPLYIARGVSGFSLNRKRYTKLDGSKEEYAVCSSLQQLLTRLIKDVGVVGGSSHSGRRTFATRLSERGVDDSLIQALLGHGDPTMTMSYIQVNMDLIRAAAARIYPGL